MLQFTEMEFHARIEKCRDLMTQFQLDALIVCSKHNFKYLTGYTSQFWESPTRPWFFIVPRVGECVAIVPEVGIGTMAKTSWVSNVQTWPSPRPADDGVSLITSFLNSIKPKYGRIGAELGTESRLGMPVVDLDRIRDAMKPTAFADCGRLLQEARLIKSEAEVTWVRKSAQIASRQYEKLPQFLAEGDTEADISRKFCAASLLDGADEVPFAAINSGANGIEDPIGVASERIVSKGDVLFIDSGVVCGGYFCDFDRLWALGSVTDSTRTAYDMCFRATDAGIAAARPGNRFCDVWKAQADVLGLDESAVGARMGHSLGLQLTEAPSVSPRDERVLEVGMVITIEPGLMYDGNKVMLHEENVVIREDGCELLSVRAPAEIPVI